LSLTSKEKAKKSLVLGTYIIAGGVSSVLILFLLRKSFFLDSQSATKYHRDIDVALDEVHKLEHNFLTSQFNTLNPEIADELDILEDSLKSQIDVVKQSLTALKATPHFLSQQQQDQIKNNLKNQEILLASRYQAIKHLYNNQAVFHQSCAKASSLKQELVDNQGTVSLNLVGDHQSWMSLNDLLDSSLAYCQTREPKLILAIQHQAQDVLLALEQTKNDDRQTEFINEIKNLVVKLENQQSLDESIELDTLINQLQDLETDYVSQYQKHLQDISNYRLIASVLILLSVVFIAYKIIGNLSRTNRNIVKILEGFTQELESKVEDRTAQLEESIQKTEAALAQAQNANQAKSRFLANMSHELRTPLNAILGFTQLMTRDASIGKEQQENLKIINRSGEHLLKLINDILEMSKIEVGQINLNESKFDLHIMLKSIEEMLRLRANAKNLNLSFNIASDVPRIINTDEGKLRQIIINLLGNALKFTEIGSVVLKVKKESNYKSAGEQAEFLFADTYGLHFAVEDTGPGVAAEEIGKLFTPFEQTKIGRLSNEGTGLGLSICHKFVELMGGELKAKSTVGQGSVFYFQIPLREQEANVAIANQPERQRKVIALAENQPNYRILAVDDVPASRLLLNKLLTGIGFAVQEAADGLEAIALWRQWHPNLILMDMRMPIIDGYEATQQIKATTEGKNTIIIALTASAFEEERVEILSAGCDDFMRKPFQEAELLTKIGQYLNVDYLYEETGDTGSEGEKLRSELTQASLAVMPESWRSQLYDAAAQVDNEEIFQLLKEIPEDYQALAEGLADLAEQFRCDRIIDLAKSGD
jgi:signal transduction histidine kinase/DNA-binding response OmpR family regulator